MAGITQVTFNPQLWRSDTDGTTPGSNGYDCFSVWPHGDTATFWGFEWFGCGFAHLNYSDGSILRQDIHFANIHSSLVTREDGGVVFTKDNNGHIFLVDSNSGSIYKMHVSSTPSAPPAKVTSTSGTSNVFTVIATNSFAVGDNVYVSAPGNQRQVNATWLQGEDFTVLSASSSQFTMFNSGVTEADYTALPETEMTIIGTTGTILNGYEVVDGVYAIDSFYFEDSKWFSSGGTNYVAYQDGEFITVINADTMGVTVTGSQTTGMSNVFGFWDSSNGTLGETMIQNTSGASATLIAYTNQPTNPSYFSMVITGITGTPNSTDNWIGQSSGAQWDTAVAPFPGAPISISGFLYGEAITQNNTGASSFIFSQPGSSPTTINTDKVSGSANSSDIWVGQTSGAVFTPTASPVVAGLVGTFDSTGNFRTNAYGWNIFGDSSGIMWALVANGGYNTWADHGSTLFRWDPADGVDGSNNLIMQTMFLSNAPTYVQGRVTSGIFIVNEAVVQNSTGATANLVGGAENNSQTGPLYMTGLSGSPSFADYWVGQDSGAIFTPSITGPYLFGSVTSGTFQVNESVTQNSTGATATMIGKVTGNYAMFIGTSISGSADDVNDWVGNSSGAVYSPTAQPITSTTQNTNLAYSSVLMAYIPSTNSVFLSSDLSTATGDACVIDMSTWNRTAYQPDNLKFIVDLDYDESEEGADIGFQGTQMMVEGSSATPFQTGGILNLVNPDLTISSSIDVVQSIRDQAGLLPIQETRFNHAQVGYISNVSQPSGPTTTITCTYNNMVVGNTANFADVAYATWLGSSVITAVSPTGFTITAADHSPYNHSEPAPYSVAYCEGNQVIPTLCSYAYNPTTNQVAAVFNFQGTPVYIVPTAEALFNPATGGPTTLTVAGGYDGSTSSPPVDLVISKLPTTTVTLTFTNPAILNLPITFNVSVNQPTGGTVTLTDTFESVTTTLAVLTLTPSGSNSIANYTTSSLALGSHLIAADYGGDTTYLPSSGNVTQQISNPVYTYIPVPSFALIGTYSTQGDGNLGPSAAAALVPTQTSGDFIVPSTPVFVIWNITNIVQVRITGDNGVDPAVDSGFISTVGLNSGSFEIPNGFTQDITLTFVAYSTISPPVTVTVPLVADYDSGTMTSISISPLNSTIPVTTTEPFTATAHYSNGGTAVLRSPSWLSSDTANATINASGVATGVLSGGGGSNISATYVTPTSPPVTLSASTHLNVVGQTPVIVQMNLNGELEFPLTGSVTTNSPVTIGNFLVGMVAWRPGGAAVASYSDTLGNSWTTQSVPQTSPPGSPWTNMGLGYAPVTVAGIDTVHDNVVGGIFNFIYNVANYIMELSHVDTFEGDQITDNISGTSVISVTYTAPDSSVYTFATTNAYSNWYAAISSFSMSVSPGTRALVAFVALNDAVGLSETVSGWTLVSTGQLGASYCGIYVKMVVN